MFLRNVGRVMKISCDVSCDVGTVGPVGRVEDFFFFSLRRHEGLWSCKWARWDLGLDAKHVGNAKASAVANKDAPETSV